MASKTFNRKVLSVNTPTSSQVNDLFFTHTNWKGLSDNKNYLTVDQETFSDCDNVYVDKDGILKSRPIIKPKDVFIRNPEGGLTDVKDVWYFEDVVVYLSAYRVSVGGTLDTTYYLTFVTKSEDYIQIECSENVKLVCAELKIFVFEENSFRYYDIENSTVNIATNYIYIPVTKVTIDGTTDDLEQPNEFITSYIHRYLYTNYDSIDFYSFVGNTLTIIINKKEYTVTFTEYSKYVMVGDLHDFHESVERVKPSGTKPGDNAYELLDGEPLIFTSRLGNFIRCEYEYNSDTWSVYYSADGLLFKLLPSLKDIVTVPKLTKDGYHVIALCKDGPYAISVVDYKDDYFVKWTNLLDYLDKDWYSENKSKIIISNLCNTSNYDDFKNFCVYYAVRDILYNNYESYTSWIESNYYYQLIYRLSCINGELYLDLIHSDNHDKAEKINVPDERYLRGGNSSIHFTGDYDGDVYLDKIFDKWNTVIYDYGFKNSEHYFAQYNIKIKSDGYTDVRVYFCKGVGTSYSDAGVVILHEKLYQNLKTEGRFGNLTVRSEFPNPFVITSTSNYIDNMYYVYITVGSPGVLLDTGVNMIVENENVSSDYIYAQNDFMSALVFRYRQSTPFDQNTSVDKKKYKALMITKQLQSEDGERNITTSTSTLYDVGILMDIKCTSTNKILLLTFDSSSNMLYNYVYDNNWTHSVIKITNSGWAFSKGKFSDDASWILTEYDLIYNLDTFDSVELLFPCKPIGIYDKRLYMVKDTELYSSTGIKSLQVDELHEGNIKYILPSHVSELSNYYLSKDKTLWISSYPSSGDFKWYFPKINTEIMDFKITNLHPISLTEMAVFTENNVYYIKTGEQGYEYYKSKIQVGCKEGSDIITSYDGKYTIFASDRGLAALTYQDFIASTEQSVTYLTDDISITFKNYNTKAIKLFKIDFWIVCYKERSNYYLVYDIRNSSWWPMSSSFYITKLVNSNNEVNIICNFTETSSAGNIAKPDSFLCHFKHSESECYDEIRYNYENVKKPVNWHIKSQKLHLNYINYFKHISNITLTSQLDIQRELDLLLQVVNYRNIKDTTLQEYFNFNVDSIRTYVIKLNYYKVNEFQYLLNSKNDELPLESTKPLSLSNIIIKYKVTGQVR